jgi:hypothetical protein
MKIDKFSIFKTGRLPVKMDQFLKGEVVHKNRSVSEMGKSLVKIDHFLKRG